jgi:hypothetical protein
MAATITQSDRDTPKTVEDKVRKLPANQGLNNYDLWVLIDAEVAQSRTDAKLIENHTYVAANKHGSR